jgi:hypothetical protein
MNKPENVPIATLAGVASLQEVIAELPLPGSVSNAEEASLFLNEQTSTEVVELLKNPIQDVNRLQPLLSCLGTVNTAYLDFKNSSHNRACFYPDPSILPPVAQQLIATKVDVFHPQFDAYHGSPLKQGHPASMPYSPSQRTAFMYHQQALHQQQQLVSSFSSQLTGSSITPSKVMPQSPLFTQSPVYNMKSLTSPLLKTPKNSTPSRLDVSPRKQVAMNNISRNLAGSNFTQPATATQPTSVKGESEKLAPGSISCMPEITRNT